jgi:chromosome segregation ATPase
MSQPVVTNPVVEVSKKVSHFISEATQSAIYFGHLIYKIVYTNCIRYWAAFKGIDNIKKVFIENFYDGTFSTGVELSCLTKKEITVLSIETSDLPFLSKWYRIFNEAMNYVFLDGKRNLLKTKRDEVIDQFFEKTNSEIDKLNERLAKDFDDQPQKLQFQKALEISHEKIETVSMAIHGPITLPSEVDPILKLCDVAAKAIEETDKCLSFLKELYERCDEDIELLESQFQTSKKELNFDKKNAANLITLNGCGLRLEHLRASFQEKVRGLDRELVQQTATLAKVKSSMMEKKEALTHHLEQDYLAMKETITKLHTELNQLQLKRQDLENELHQAPRVPTPDSPQLREQNRLQNEINELQNQLDSAPEMQADPTDSYEKQIDRLQQKVKTLTAINQIYERLASLRRPRAPRQA